MCMQQLVHLNLSCCQYISTFQIVEHSAPNKKYVEKMSERNKKTTNINLNGKSRIVSVYFLICPTHQYPPTFFISTDPTCERSSLAFHINIKTNTLFPFNAKCACVCSIVNPLNWFVSKLFQPLFPISTRLAFTLKLKLNIDKCIEPFVDSCIQVNYKWMCIENNANNCPRNHVILIQI